VGDPATAARDVRYGGREPYFIGEGGQAVGPGYVDCTTSHELRALGVSSLIPVGHLTWVTPLTRERGWLWSVPVGLEVFRDADPPAHPKQLWVKTGDDCYVWAHGYLG
jgi:hypothetical protein